MFDARDPLPLVRQRLAWRGSGRVCAAILTAAFALGPGVARGQSEVSTRAGGAGATRSGSTIARPGSDDGLRLAGIVTRETLVELAVARSPALAANRARARALRIEGEAEARLPPPMAEVQILQVPVMEPYAVNRAAMVMVGVAQEFTGGRVRRERARAVRAGADVEEAMRDELVSRLAADVEHAFADYVEATELVRVHEAHRAAATTVVDFARARYAAGGALADVAMSEREVAMIEPDLALARGEVELARARLNGLLSRPPGAALGPPVAPPPIRVSADTRALVTEAHAARPELRVALARREAAEAEALAEARMARAPTMTAGVAYFAPTEPMPEHAFGASFSTTLPWLWGAGETRSRAARALVEATLDEQDAARAQIAGEVATAAAMAAAMARRLDAIRTEVLPAAERAELAALAGYESSTADILAVLGSRTAVANTEVEIVMARAELEHALTELRFAAGRSGRPPPGGTRDVP